MIRRCVYLEEESRSLHLHTDSLAVWDRRKARLMVCNAVDITGYRGGVYLYNPTVLGQDLEYLGIVLNREVRYDNYRRYLPTCE